MNLFKDFLKDTKAATAVEYSLIAGLIAVALILGASTMGIALRDLFLEKIVKALQ